MLIEQVLEDLGLTDKEPDVYLALLKTPGVQPASVIAKKVSLNRITVYKTLMKLAEMGLVTKTMKFGITCFFVEEPDKVLEAMMSKRKAAMGNLEKQLLAALPDIRALRQQEFFMPRMRFYEGAEGVKRVYEDTLMEKKQIDAFENVADIPPEIFNYLENDYIPRRIENGIFTRVIAPLNAVNKKFRKATKIQLRETRLTTLAAFPVEIEINIYGHKTAFFSYKAEEMFGVILESPAIANSMLAIFECCWRIAK